MSERDAPERICEAHKRANAGDRYHGVEKQEGKPPGRRVQGREEEDVLLLRAHALSVLARTHAAPPALHSMELTTREAHAVSAGSRCCHRRVRRHLPTGLRRSLADQHVDAHPDCQDHEVGSIEGGYSAEPDERNRAVRLPHGNCQAVEHDGDGVDAQSAH